MECKRGFQTTNEITESCLLGRNYAIALKIGVGAKTTAMERNNAAQSDKCHYGIVSNKPDDCHCMWKLMANRDDMPMTIRDIAKVLCLCDKEVEEALDSALTKLKRTDYIALMYAEKLAGVDIYEGLTPYYEDVDMWCEHSLSGVTGHIQYEDQPEVVVESGSGGNAGEADKKRRGPTVKKTSFGLMGD